MHAESGFYTFKNKFEMTISVRTCIDKWDFIVLGPAAARSIELSIRDAIIGGEISIRIPNQDVTSDCCMLAENACLIEHQ